MITECDPDSNGTDYLIAGAQGRVNPQLDADPSPSRGVGVSSRVIDEKLARQPPRGTVPFVPPRYVDPHQRRGPVYRANVRFGRSRAGQFVARHIARHTDPYVFRLSGGRVNMGSIITAPLVATGAKSGQPRETQLTYFHDGPDVILLASNYGGSKHPQWYYNLKAHPECEFGKTRFSAALVTDASEYARLFELAERVYAGYGDYRAKTAPLGRQIPIFRLTPR